VNLSTPPNLVTADPNWMIPTEVKLDYDDRCKYKYVFGCNTPPPVQTSLDKEE
jgi:hypothetical protein